MFNVLLASLLASVGIAADCSTISSVQDQLAQRLSNGSSIVSGNSAPPRWNELGAPKPQTVVNVASAEDVAATIKYCNEQNTTFVVQNGGNGWATTFNLGDCGMVINIEGLSDITFNENKTRATIGGGVRVQDMIDAAWANDTRFANPSCPCLGFLGTSLGGGLNRMSGSYGWSVDQIESFTVVLASGDLVAVTNDTDPDLYWAVRGAAANFGVVTSAVVKAYPTPQEENYAWQGPVIFSEDKLEDLVTAINDLDLGAIMEIDIIFTTSGAPDYTPTITALPFYLSNNATEAEEAFSTVLDIGPTVNNATLQPYSIWSDWNIPFCEKGGRKPAFGASGSHLDPVAFHTVFDEFKAFVDEHGGEQVGNTSLLVEVYGLQKGLEIGDADSSYPYRNLSYHIVAIPWYTNETLDDAADAWGKKVRGLLRTNDGLDRNSTYINFAHGDETLEDIYGQSLPRLQALKAAYDPDNRFNQWFPLA